MNQTWLRINSCEFWSLQVCHTLHSVRSQTCPLPNRSLPSNLYFAILEWLVACLATCLTTEDDWSSQCLGKVTDLEPIYTTQMLHVGHIYLHLPNIKDPNVDRYSSTMEQRGYFSMRTQPGLQHCVQDAFQRSIPGRGSNGQKIKWGNHGWKPEENGGSMVVNGGLMGF